MTWPCFWVEFTGNIELSLRRLVMERAGKPACPSGYHEAASDPIGVVPARVGEDNTLGIWTPDEFEGHEAWPTTCQWCFTYEFEPDDVWQVNQQRIYARPDTGDSWPERRLPPGAMFDGVWRPQKGPDGIALMMVLPPEEPDSRSHWWHVDGPSYNHGKTGPGWKRTGDPKAVPPTVEVTPSILTSDYHGFVRVGPQGSFLTDHVG